MGERWREILESAAAAVDPGGAIEGNLARRAAELEARVATLTEQSALPCDRHLVRPDAKLRCLFCWVENAVARAEAAEREAATLQEALAFYSDEGNYRMEVHNAPATGERYGAPGPIARDEGRRARAALAGAGR